MGRVFLIFLGFLFSWLGLSILGLLELLNLEIIFDFPLPQDYRAITGGLILLAGGLSAFYGLMKKWHEL